MNMKYIVYITLASIGISLGAVHESTDYQVQLEPLWINLDASGAYEKQFGNKWILVGSITFRKKANEALKMEHLMLQWHGAKIDHICGSIYKKLPERKFLAIEENLICDSAWNQASQTLIFDFQNNRQTLGPLTIIYLVLSIPNTVESQLISGYFSLNHSGLPAQLQEYAKLHHTDLSLKINLAHTTNPFKSCA